MPRGRIKVAVCVCTYRRLDGLRNLLLGIAQLRFERIAEPDIEIIVVENDHTGSGRPICDALRGILRWPLRYEIEANPGISNARNRCLRIAAEDSDLVAFLDDDEMPTPLWLEALLLAHERYGADVVAGPVLGVYQQCPPRFMTHFPFHSSERRESGTLVDECGAGNVLFAAKLVTKQNLQFEQSMGLCGGEDKLFFASAHRKGARMVWCNEAIVEEVVPPERATVLWLLRRAFRIGVAAHKCARHLDGSLSALVQSLWLGCTRIGAGLVSLPVTVAFGQHRSVVALCRIAFGAGCILAVGGYNINAYRPKA